MADSIKDCESAIAELEKIVKQLEEGGLDEEQRFATTAILAEILFPQKDRKGMPGLDLVETETMAPDAEFHSSSSTQLHQREFGTLTCLHSNLTGRCNA